VFDLGGRERSCRRSCEGRSRRTDPWEGSFSKKEGRKAEAAGEETAVLGEGFRVSQETISEGRYRFVEGGQDGTGRRSGGSKTRTKRQKHLHPLCLSPSLAMSIFRSLRQIQNVRFAHNLVTRTPA
jgi:hypothetical protein